MAKGKQRAKNNRRKNIEGEDKVSQVDSTKRER